MRDIRGMDRSETDWAIWTPRSPNGDRERSHTRGMKKMPCRAMATKVAGTVRPMVWSIMLLMVIDPLRHPAAGAALRSGQGEIPLLQQLEAHRFQALHIHAVHIVSQSRADLCHHRGEHGLRLLCAGGLGGGPQPHLAGLGISG